ncbi:MAG TPA: hypothetical protein VFQ35_08110 [Polyangiaceae bacterium]|nr:hypothetical protein [Polyangiaceae bacterium]
MARFRVEFFALAVALAHAACSEQERPGAPQANSSGGRSSGGFANTSGGASRGGSLGAGGSAGHAGVGEAGEAGAAGDGGARGEPLPPLCSPEQNWSEGQRLAFSAAGDDELVGVSGDELSIAWFAAGELRYADRAKRTDAFGAPVPVAGGADYFGGATLSSDGLSLIAVRKDGKSFGLLRRASRTDAFAGAFDEAPFVQIAAAPGTFRARGPFGDPVLAPNGLSLVYSNLDPAADGGPSLYESSRLGSRDAWPFGEPIDGNMLVVSGSSFRRPSAISTDKRTLFYWDEAERESRAAFRSYASGPFETAVSLGERARAVPNAECDRLYYSAPGAQGLDVFVASLTPP